MQQTATQPPPSDTWLDLRLSLPGGPLLLTSGAQVIGLYGPSGAGKSTLLRAIAGVERLPGTLRVDGQPWQDAATLLPPWQRRVGWAPQDGLLFPHLSVRENLGYADPPPDPGALASVAAMLEIAHLLDRRPRHLSGGERQRAALGRALLARPRLLLLDEPFSSLDRDLRSRVAERLAGWLRDRPGCAALIVSHDPRDLAPLGAEAWRLEGGRLERV